MGGGGGNTTTQVSGVPDWLRPDVQYAFGEASRLHRGDEEGRSYLARTAEFAPGQQEFLGRTAAEGISPHAQRLLANQEGQALAGQANTGTLGSARADALRAQQQGNLAANLAQQDLQARDQAYGQLKQQRQAQLDEDHTGLQRLFGYYGSGAAGSQQTQSGGGGK